MKTVSTSTISQSDIKHSRFIAELLPYKQLEQRLSELRAEHRKASHHVVAYRYFNDQRQLIEHGKDDGEVSGTAGGPALRVLQGQDLVECGLIIVRYFGGIKLGTGGLIKAYSDAADTVVQAAKFIKFTHKSEASLSCKFNQLSELETLCSQHHATVLDRDYFDGGMTLIIRGDETNIENIQHDWEQFILRQSTIVAS